MTSALKQAMKLALIQLRVTADKAENVQRACVKVKEACEKGGANLVCLPECFNSPYGTQHFPEYAESIPGKTTDAIAAAAKENKCFLIGGSIPERDGSGKLFNTSCVFSPNGDIIGKFRKIHLFDIDIPGKIRFMESEVLSPGSNLLSFEIPVAEGSSKPIKVGIGICYDIRFPVLAKLYKQQGCHLIVYPGAFNMTTGPMHWELLQRARATDNQLYIAACSPARDESAGGYVAWANSSIVDPWAKVISQAAEDEAIIYADIDTSVVDNVRSSIPISKQVRTDVYTESSLVE